MHDGTCRCHGRCNIHAKAERDVYLAEQTKADCAGSESKKSKHASREEVRKSYWLLCCSYSQDCFCLTHPGVYTHTNVHACMRETNALLHSLVVPLTGCHCDKVCTCKFGLCRALGPQQLAHPDCAPHTKAISKEREEDVAHREHCRVRIYLDGPCTQSFRFSHITS